MKTDWSYGYCRGLGPQESWNVWPVRHLGQTHRYV